MAITPNFPEVYKTRYYHDDWAIKGIPRWLQPWTYIPRHWTGLELYMMPRKVFGNAVERLVDIQPGYPLAPDSIRFENQVWGIDPVHPIGQWSIQSVYLGWLGRRVPCYFSMSAKVFGRRLHTNFGIKPDITKGDWYWWIEGSLTYKAIN